jgi:hypothetical protein
VDSIHAAAAAIAKRGSTLLFPPEESITLDKTLRIAKDWLTVDFNGCVLSGDSSGTYSQVMATGTNGQVPLERNGVPLRCLVATDNCLQSTWKGPVRIDGGTATDKSSLMLLGPQDGGGTARQGGMTFTGFFRVQNGGICLGLPATDYGFQGVTFENLTVQNFEIGLYINGNAGDEFHIQHFRVGPPSQSVWANGEIFVCGLSETLHPDQVVGRTDGVSIGHFYARGSELYQAADKVSFGRYRGALVIGSFHPELSFSAPFQLLDKTYLKIEELQISNETSVEAMQNVPVKCLFLHSSDGLVEITADANSDVGADIDVILGSTTANVLTFGRKLRARIDTNSTNDTVDKLFRIVSVDGGANPNSQTFIGDVQLNTAQGRFTVYWDGTTTHYRPVLDPDKVHVMRVTNTSPQNLIIDTSSASLGDRLFNAGILHLRVDGQGGNDALIRLEAPPAELLGARLRVMLESLANPAQKVTFLEQYPNFTDSYVRYDGPKIVMDRYPEGAIPTVTLVAMQTETGQRYWYAEPDNSAQNRGMRTRYFTASGSIDLVDAQIVNCFINTAGQIITVENVELTEGATLYVLNRGPSEIAVTCANGVVEPNNTNVAQSSVPARQLALFYSYIGKLQRLQ